MTPAAEIHLTSLKKNSKSFFSLWLIFMTPVSDFQKRANRPHTAENLPKDLLSRLANHVEVRQKSGTTTQSGRRLHIPGKVLQSIRIGPRQGLHQRFSILLQRAYRQLPHEIQFSSRFLLLDNGQECPLWKCNPLPRLEFKLLAGDGSTAAKITEDANRSKNVFLHCHISHYASIPLFLSSKIFSLVNSLNAPAASIS